MAAATSTVASTSSAAAHGAMARLRERWPTLPVTVT